MILDIHQMANGQTKCCVKKLYKTFNIGQQKHVLLQLKCFVTQRQCEIYLLP